MNTDNFAANKSTHQKGTDGEDKAVGFLISENYSIVARNWRTRYGEIDIIAFKDDTLVFAEVKALPSGQLETLAHELNKRKQKKIVETAKFFLLNHREYSNSKIRFDVLVVDMPSLPSVYHIVDAFSEQI